jgi:hypothetical protein
MQRGWDEEAILDVFFLYEKKATARHREAKGVFVMVCNILEPALLPYVIQLRPTEESQMGATVKRKGDRPDVILMFF